MAKTSTEIRVDTLLKTLVASICAWDAKLLSGLQLTFRYRRG